MPPPAYVFRALYGVADQVIDIELSTGGHPEADGTSNEQLLAINKHSSGAPVGTQPFIDGSMPTIAGAIVSVHNSGGAAHRPRDFTLYPISRQQRLGPRTICQLWNGSSSDSTMAGKAD